MNILVINLTRFGDLLQSAAAIRALAGPLAGSRHRISVVCLENFTGGAELLPDVAAVYPLPAAAIMKRSNPGGPSAAASGSPAGWLEGLGCLYAWVDTVRKEFSPDAICNLSPSTPSCLLARLLAEDRELTGFTLDAFGFSHATSLWASFIQGAAAARTTSPFNIVDLFHKLAQPESTASNASLLPVPGQDVAAMRERLLSASPERPAGFVALQLGASADIRRWPVPSFVLTGDALWERHRLLPILIGTKIEIPLGEEYALHAKQPFVSMMGKTDLMELAAALTVSSLCISNDTGTLHLASGLNVPVLGIYLATAQPWDTGPYAAGSCALEPDLPCHPCNFGAACVNAFACHTAVRPETVIGLASAKLTEQRWRAENFADTAHAHAGSRIWETERDAYGFADLRSLSGHETDHRTQWMRLQRHVYRQFFDRKPREAFVPTAPATPFRLDPGIAGPLKTSCDEALALLDVLEQQAVMLARAPLPVIKEKFSRTWRRLTALLRSQRDLTAIAFCWQTESTRQHDLDHATTLTRQYKAFFSHVRSLLG